MSFVFRTQAKKPTYSLINKYPITDSTGRELTLSIYSDGDISLWAHSGFSLEFKKGGVAILRKALQALAKLPEQVVKQPVEVDTQFIERERRVAEMQELYEKAQHKAEEKTGTLLVKSKAPHITTAVVHSGNIHDLFDDNAKVTTVEKEIPAHVDAIPKKVVTPKTAKVVVKDLPKVAPKVVLKEEKSEARPRSVSKDDLGWGATVYNAKGASTRYYYDKRDQARLAEFGDRIGRKGRVA